MVDSLNRNASWRTTTACSTWKWRHGLKRSALRTSIVEFNFTLITVIYTYISLIHCQLARCASLVRASP